jgi:hypothetical protein
VNLSCLRDSVAAGYGKGQACHEHQDIENPEGHPCIHIYIVYQK